MYTLLATLGLWQNGHGGSVPGSFNLSSLVADIRSIFSLLIPIG
jgi:hypothetical protein